MEKDMNMRDDEFDDRLRQKLENFEAEPSAQVWQNIDVELDGKARKKRIFTILSVAASVIILIAAGILFIPGKEIVKPGRHGKNDAALTRVKPSARKPENNAPVNVRRLKDIPVARAQAAATYIAGIHQPGKKIAIPAAQSITDTPGPTAQSEPVKPEQQPVLAAVSQKADKIAVPVVEMPAEVKRTQINETPAFQLQPVLASEQTPAVKQNKPVVKRHGIRNFGDLVNLVVAKVDKRRDKVIEFTDTDDDQTTITGVHIGAIRIKKDN
ncbi:MAG: hypothetical protein JWP78_3669 [Mucilaginibacter sp.]|nr:hypothetical protein [Mucilaginibacter sp.]